MGALPAGGRGAEGVRRRPRLVRGARAGGVVLAPLVLGGAGLAGRGPGTVLSGIAMHAPVLPRWPPSSGPGRPREAPARAPAVASMG
ncbi:MAG: hypothetical protein ACRD03_11495, partial [Acidimicrobiales bacterium]